MQAAVSSPPFIFDSDMSGARLDQDPDFEFFDTNRAANSEGIFLPDDFPTDGAQFLNFGTPVPASHKSPLPESASLLDTRIHRDPSAPSTASPGGSSQDSSSESSGYKRTSSFESSRSVVTPGDLEMADDADLGDWKVENMMGESDGFGGYHGTIDPSAMDANFGSSDKAMDSMFDFASASSSPSTFGTGVREMDSPEMQIIKTDSPSKDAPMLKKMKYRNSQNSITQSMNDLTTAGSREVSPLSAMAASHESSPSALFHNSPSPVAHVDFGGGPMFNGQFAQPNSWPARFDNQGIPMPNVPHMPHMPPGMNGYIPHPMHRMAPGQMYPNMANIKPTLTIHPIPLKSRVETQIPIKMSLFPFPPGIVKLHLPTHTISKPKLLAKPTPERSPNTLELHTSLVCSSAMQNPENRRRAFERAANPGALSEVSSPNSGTDEEPTSKALNGGDVEICPGCITRERKRAARKKIKKVEEEESWHQYEAKRVIVFNTQEVKEWQQPTPQPPTDATGDRPEPQIPYGALQVDAPMRIACYCRHQNEKVGFQVIFTIKDFQDRVIAQAMTSSIMITDDHKTHNLPASSSQQNSDGSDTPVYNGGGGPFPPAETAFPVSSGAAATVPPFRLSHSSSDLQGMQRNYNLQFQPSVPATPSQTTSATMTPRNMSRQTSPSAPTGPAAKKRKASGSGKVPTGLAMTRMENAVQPESSGTLSTGHSTAPSPFASSINTFPPVPEPQFGQPPTTIPNIPQQYNTGPPTPNSNSDQLFFANVNRSQSMENLALHQMYSAPSSAHPSRVPSPNSFRNNVSGYQQQQAQASAQLAQSIANGFYGLPSAINPHMPPTIHKLIPNEGPKAGGIEVTCLGSGFCQGLEVMFGESKATTTTYWGETSLVCLLPPSAFSGTVAVTFKHQQNQSLQFASMPKHQAFFKYVDDDEQQLIRTALSVLGAKMTGKMEDVGELARRIVGDGSSWGSSNAQSPPNGLPNHNGFNAATFGLDVEATVLKCLDLIDLDDSPHMPRLNLRRASGQTMLHLACSIGLNRVVAALLARGANPEPRDKGGFTPMHFAALHNHAQIVRRLMLSGADPTVRSLLGYTPSDMSTSEEVLRAARRIEHHSRTRSGTSLKSRTSSATSLRSLWEPPSTPSHFDDDEDGDDVDDSSDGADQGEYQDEDADAANDGAFWMKSRQSRRSSAIKPPAEDSVDESDPVLELPTIDPARAVLAPTAAYAAFQTAFQKHVQAHFQNIQQHMHLNLPNLPQMPRFDMMMNLPGYQAPMVRRISNLVGNNRPEGAREQDYKWWDLFSGTVTAEPPAYEEIFPQGDVDTKRASATQAAADTVADNKCAELFDQVEVEAEASSSRTAQRKPVVLDTVMIGQKHIITREQQDQLRLAHAEKVKRLSRDRNLFFIWIPILVIIILAMLYNRVPQVWTGISRLMESGRIQPHNDQARLVEVPVEVQ